ncbi:MAG: hypothetical protein HC819_10175 [Cyclobacteriaceae bacterium]|nr:hypothetical protein [Cyclobacteriaceae bacterium]
MMLLDISSWWAALAFSEKIYWIIVLPATVLFIIQLVMTLLGSDTDDMSADGGTGLDIDGDADGGVGWQFFTYKNVLGFFMLFGWTGLGFLNMGLGLFLVILFSATCGFVMMVVMAALFYYIGKLDQNGTMVIERAIGRSGDVYLRVPANRAGHGKVMVEIQGTLREMEAITDDEKDLPTGSVALVLEIVNNQILLVTQVLY